MELGVSLTIPTNVVKISEDASLVACVSNVFNPSTQETEEGGISVSSRTARTVI